MKILLINLPRYRSIPVTREERCEFVSKSCLDTPSTLMIIASLLREKSHEIDFIDANAFNLSYENVSEQMIKKFDCVIFPFCGSIIDHDLEICNIAKKINPSCITIGYSWYSRCFAKEILTEYSNLDICIIESVLSVVGNLIECLSENGNLDNVSGIGFRDLNNIIKINNKVCQEIKLNDLPLPAYDLLPSFKPYYLFDPFLSPCALLYSGKGCPFGCTYCNVAKTKYSSRSVDNVIKELKILKKRGVKYVWFYDEAFTINRKRVTEICKRILEEDINIKWFCDSRVELVNEELLKIMRKSGCIGIAYGVESGSQKILNSMNKGNTVEQAKNALIWTRKAHIPIQLNIRLGFIGENKKTLDETKSFIRATCPEMLSIGYICALPGTEFTRLAIEHKWIDPECNWREHLIGHRLSDEFLNCELEKEIIKIKKTLYYNPKWWIAVITSLIRNPELFLPVVGMCFREKYEKLLLWATWAKE